MDFYVIRAARNEDSNEGWVWMREYPSRTVLKLTRAAAPRWKFWSRRSVYCQARQIDHNFLADYNRRKRTVAIRDRHPTIVMSGWYRDALGGLKAATKGIQKPTKIKVRRSSIPLWRSLRAASHHPEVTVRLGTRLGVLGVWMGVVSLAPTIWSFLSTICIDLIPVEFFTLLFASAVGVPAALACRPPGKPLK